MLSSRRDNQAHNAHTKTSITWVSDATLQKKEV